MEVNLDLMGNKKLLRSFNHPDVEKNSEYFTLKQNRGYSIPVVRVFV